MRRVPSAQRNSKIRHDRDVHALYRFAVLLGCGLILAGGFVYAARQHFSAVEYGYQTELLRREREKLLQEQQHLMLLREQAFSPARLELQARELGLKPLLAGQLGVSNPSNQSQVSLAPALINPAAALRR